MLRNKIKCLHGILLIVVLTASLLGCSSNAENEIIFWNFFTGPDGENMNNLVNGFNDTNPKYKVKNITMEAGDLYTKIPTVVNSGKGVPDLTVVDIARIPMFYNQGLLKDFNMLIKENSNLNSENYNKLAWDAGQFDNTQYAIPLDIGAICLVYNKELLKKYAPNVLDDNVLTIEEIMEIIPRAKKDGIVTLPVSFFSYEQALSLTLQQGAEIFIDENTPNIDSKEFKKAIQTLKQIVDAGGASDDGDDNLQLFQSGKAIFLADGVWDANALNSIDELDWGVANTIAYSPDNYYNFANSNQFVMLKNDKRTEDKEKVIADFLDYVRENALEWAKSGQIPASNAADDSQEYKEMKQYFLISTKEQEEALRFHSYKFGGYADDAITKVINDMLYGKISIEDGLKQAQKQTEDNINQVLEK